MSKSPPKRHLEKPGSDGAVLCGSRNVADDTEDPRKATCGNCIKIHKKDPKGYTAAKRKATLARNAARRNK